MRNFGIIGGTSWDLPPPAGFLGLSIAASGLLSYLLTCKDATALGVFVWRPDALHRQWDVQALDAAISELEQAGALMCDRGYVYVRPSLFQPSQKTASAPVLQSLARQICALPSSLSFLPQFARDMLNEHHLEELFAQHGTDERRPSERDLRGAISLLNRWATQQQKPAEAHGYGMDTLSKTSENTRDTLSQTSSNKSAQGYGIHTLSVGYTYPIHTVSMPYRYPTDTVAEKRREVDKEEKENKEKKNALTASLSNLDSSPQDQNPVQQEQGLFELTSETPVDGPGAGLTIAVQKGIYTLTAADERVIKTSLDCDDARLVKIVERAKALLKARAERVKSKERVVSWLISIGERLPVITSVEEAPPEFQRLVREYLQASHAKPITDSDLPALVTLWANVGGTVPEVAEAMVQGVIRDRRSEKWQTQGGLFIPKLATYLEKQQWREEPFVPLHKRIADGAPTQTSGDTNASDGCSVSFI